MSLYELPEIKIPKFQAPQGLSAKNIFIIVVLLSFLGGFLGVIAGSYFLELARASLTRQNSEQPLAEPPLVKSQEQDVVSAVNQASPAVVSIIVSKNLPIYEQCFINPFGDLFPGFQIPQICQKGTKLQEVGGGSGFIITRGGLILTNKHVVSDKEAEYTVLTNDGEKYTAKALFRDPDQDLAIIKIGTNSTDNLPVMKLGDSDNLQIGQTTIAIGNALGEFKNTVSVGVVSGLGRTIVATGGGISETIEDVIQTDAAINSGNSGGPLLNLKGEVIGINTAMVSGAQNIGFAIPINYAKSVIENISMNNAPDK